jgi:hypothetical protein
MLLAGQALTKSAREIMETLDSFDLTLCCWSAGALAGADPKTVVRYVAPVRRRR